MVAGHIQWFLAEETTATAKAALDYYFPDANRRSAPAATGLVEITKNKTKKNPFIEMCSVMLMGAVCQL